MSNSAPIPCYCVVSPRWSWEEGAAASSSSVPFAMRSCALMFLYTGPHTRQPNMSLEPSLEPENPLQVLMNNGLLATEKMLNESGDLVVENGRKLSQPENDHEFHERLGNVLHAFLNKTLREGVGGGSGQG